MGTGFVLELSKNIETSRKYKTKCAAANLIKTYWKIYKLRQGGSKSPIFHNFVYNYTLIKFYPMKNSPKSKLFSTKTK